MKITPDSPKSSTISNKSKEKEFRRVQRRLSEAKGVNSSTAGRHSPDIELYQKEECPFSRSVRMRLSRLGLDFIAHSVPDGSDLKHKQLVDAGGKDQIPFLIDHKTGTKLYESGAILSYLEKEYGYPEESRVLKIAQRLNHRISIEKDRIAHAVLRPVESVTWIRRDFGATLKTLRSSFDEVRTAVKNGAQKSGAQAE